jgi:S-(hydroxymethyl)glutathione dehydrogenase/alcohol dehydrogenase
MRAAILRALDEPMSVEDVELGRPGPGEVEVRLVASGVCHSDWNVVTGATANPLPAVLGHEGAGVVESVGGGVDAVKEGDHVILSWLPACGRCYYCSRGRQVLCDVAMEDMFRGTLPGGTLRLSQNGESLYHYSYLSAFAERCIVPEGCCVPIRDDAPLEVAALVGCAVMTGYGAATTRAGIRAGEAIAVFGAGGVGLSAIMGARLAGAAAIVAVDPFPFRREMALELGATHALDPRSDDVLEALRELTNGRGADAAIDSAGARGVLAQAYAAVRRGGTVVAVGLPPDGVMAELPASDLAREEKVVTGSFYGSCSPQIDMPVVIDLYMDGVLPLDRLISRSYPLAEINEAFAAMNAGEVARAVISP